MTTRWIILLLLAMLGGCSFNMTQPARETGRFVIPEPPANTAASTTPRPGVLGIGRCIVTPPFDVRGLVYRTDELRYQADYYNEFFAAPDESIRSRIAGYFAHAKPYESVILAENLNASYELRATIKEIYGDIRDQARPAAVLTIHWYLLRNSSEVLLDREYSEHVLLPDGSPEALMRGFGSGLYRMLNLLVREFPPP
ncbi:putative ABC_trans_aux domain-containing protein [Candidatus Nitrotoga sp. HW29]|uniref:PqiC family protein n=1 Tax=Candidatus Nitrotoga sp. HW29 TaxID=2886963 RepID=UPI001EF302AA|nr:ABC-type transport auxiliary lipoprotein family protein [Candidatus Nitrotoga sp. HW29]CAH1903657.1 putative ABC_trans_aux domain-containing protein [Candidatus Nitrotoga sp. HW29]